MSFPRRTKLEGGRFTEIDFGNNKKVVRNHEIGSLLIHQNRKIFLDLIKKAQKPWEMVSNGEAKMEMVGTRSTNGVQRSFYYKYRLNGKDYFVKRIPTKAKSEFGGGAYEVAGMVEAGEMLKNISGVEVVNYHLGYEDNYDTYVISTWNDSLREQLDTYLNRKNGQILPDNLESIMQRVKKIKEALKPAFSDIFLYNMAYDEKRSVIIVFDLKKKPDKNAN